MKSNRPGLTKVNNILLLKTSSKKSIKSHCYLWSVSLTAAITFFIRHTAHGAGHEGIEMRCEA